MQRDVDCTGNVLLCAFEVAAYDPDYEVWQVTPAGRLRTASYGGRVIAAQDGWLYVAGERPAGGEVVVVRVDASAAAS